MSAPYNYEFINTYNGLENPSTVHCKNTALVQYFERYLWQKIYSVFKWKLPETWNEDFFQFVLYHLGYIVIVNTDRFGVIPMMGGLRGYNVFYAPTHAVISNPLISGILEPEIDTQCTVIKLTADYCGVSDLISYYANQMALAGEAAGMNLINSKLGYVAAARTKAMAEALKKIFDEIQKGNPAVIFDSSYKGEDGTPLFDLLVQNLKENFIAPDIMLCIKKLDNEFASKIGLSNVNTEKKERLTNEEIEANNDETYCVAEKWLERLNNGIDKAKAMFGLTDFSVDWRYTHERNSFDNGTMELR